MPDVEVKDVGGVALLQVEVMLDDHTDVLEDTVAVELLLPVPDVLDPVSELAGQLVASGVQEVTSSRLVIVVVVDVSSLRDVGLDWTGSTLGPSVGAPEKLGSAFGVAKI